MTSSEVYRAVRSYARNAIAAGALWGADLPTGVKAVDLWRTTRFGSVLFFGGASSGLSAFDFPSLHHEEARHRTIRGWVGANGGGVGLHDPYRELVADGPPGLHTLGLRSLAVSDERRALETEPVAIRLLAGPLLTIGPKRNSEALIRGLRSVAGPGVSTGLLLLAGAAVEQKFA